MLIHEIYLFLLYVTKDHVTLLEFVASIVMRMLSYCFLQVFFANFVSSVEWSPWKLWADGNTYIVLFCEFDYSRAVLANCPVMVASVALRKLRAATPREKKKLLCLGAFQFIVNFIICTGVQINACAFVTFTASDVTSNRIKIEQFKKIYTTSDISNCTRLKAGVILREFPDITVV